MKRLKHIAGQNLGIASLLILLAMRLFFSLFPSLFELLYFDLWFPFLRTFQSYFNWLWLVPGYLLILAGVLIALTLFFTRRKDLKSFFKRSINLLAFIAALFILCFGLQYPDRGVAERMELPDPPESTDMLALYFETMKSAIEQRSKIEAIEDVENITELGYQIDIEKLHRNTSTILSKTGYKASNTDVKIQEIKFGVLRKLGISGIYNPFTGECNVEDQLPELLKTFTIAHEIAHACGVTSEAEANFVAWLSLAQADDPYLNYAAAYFLWRKAAKQVNLKIRKEEAEMISAQIPIELQKDRYAIYEILSRDQPLFPELSEQVNDTYLKIQGVEAGIDDYDKFLEIYLRWKKRISQPR